MRLDLARQDVVDSLRRAMARGETEARHAMFMWRNDIGPIPQGFPYGDTWAHHRLTEIDNDRLELDANPSDAVLNRLGLRYLADTARFMGGTLGGNASTMRNDVAQPPLIPNGL